MSSSRKFLYGLQDHLVKNSKNSKAGSGQKNLRLTCLICTLNRHFWTTWHCNETFFFWILVIFYGLSPPLVELAISDKTFLTMYIMINNGANSDGTLEMILVDFKLMINSICIYDSTACGLILAFDLHRWAVYPPVGWFEMINNKQAYSIFDNLIRNQVNKVLVKWIYYF